MEERVYYNQWADRVSDDWIHGGIASQHKISKDLEYPHVVVSGLILKEEIIALNLKDLKSEGLLVLLEKDGVLVPVGRMDENLNSYLNLMHSSRAEGRYVWSEEKSMKLDVKFFNEILLR